MQSDMKTHTVRLLVVKVSITMVIGFSVVVPNSIIVFIISKIMARVSIIMIIFHKVKVQISLIKAVWKVVPQNREKAPPIKMDLI